MRSVVMNMSAPSSSSRKCCLHARPLAQMAGYPRRVTSPLALRLQCQKPVVRYYRPSFRHPVVASADISHPGEERSDSSDIRFSQSMSVPTTAMSGKGLGSSGGAATLSRSKLSLKQEVRQITPNTDDAGGGGDNGKSIFFGGGGEGDGGDDDDYSFGEGEDGGEGDGDGFFRKVLPQLYDKVSIGAVLSEWYRSVNDLPRILRRAVEMGLFSSAQLVRFCSMDVRPNMTRMISRKMSPTFSRALVGRLMADPAVCQKLMWEWLLAAGFSLAHEAKIRGDNFSKELDFVAINTAGLMAATTAVVWLLAPSRAFGSSQKLPWQSMLKDLPNNVFDASGPLRNYTGTSRAASFLAKFAELSAVGMITGATTVALSNLAVKTRKLKDEDFEPSVAIPSIQRSALGFGAFIGLHAHLRYQALGGIDRYLFEHSNFIWSYLTTSALFRTVSMGIGEASRAQFQGYPSEAPKKAVPVMATYPQYYSNVQPFSLDPSPSQTQSPKPKKKKSKGFELSLQSATP